MSTYTAGIPLSTDLISSSQSQILGNFNAIVNTTYGLARNHVAITNGTDGGLHTKVDFQAPIAAPTLGGTGGVAYPKTVTNSELFFKNAVADMQISNSLLAAASGQGMLPGGMQIRSGAFSISTPAGTTLTFSPAFPTACVAVVVTGKNSSNFPYVISITGGASASIGSSGIPINSYYIAIGY